MTIAPLALPLPNAETLGLEIMARAEALGQISEGGPGVTRLMGTPEHRRALELIGSWMQAAGMSIRQDAVGNLVGRYEGQTPGLPAYVIGSHQDTVRQGGKYDGMLGIILPLTCLQYLHRSGIRLPFAIEVPAFADEEGVRFATSLFGSRALAGTFDMAVLDRQDAAGKSLAQVLREFGCDPAQIPAAAYRRDQVLGYLEVHIEQGPVLEAQDLPVGIVDAIAGADRLSVTVLGEAGHAGTVPMASRRDALAAAAEMVLAVERVARAAPRVVATVGCINATPGAINVIPGAASLTIDLRAPDDAVRASVRQSLLDQLQHIAHVRNVTISIDHLYSMAATPCDPVMMARLEQGIRSLGIHPLRLYSGAGHDAMAMASLMPVGMLFVRCLKGISHNPGESITAQDADVAARVLLRTLEALVA